MGSRWVFASAATGLLWAANCSSVIGVDRGDNAVADSGPVQGLDSSGGDAATPLSPQDAGSIERDAGALAQADAGPQRRDAQVDLSDAQVHPDASTPTPGDGGGDDFQFVVFGDLNGGGCDRNGYLARNVARMASEPNVAFFVHTGDLIDGYVSDGETSCFAKDPSMALGMAACGDGNPNGNVAAILSPIKDRLPAAGLVSALFPVLGNHDDGWGDAWYPDPCGGGICQFLSPRTPADFINHPYRGDLCSVDNAKSAYPEPFYYSFAYRNSYFIVLHLNKDDDNMISSCNGHPGHADCASYCSDPALAEDAQRNENCWNGVEQLDFLRGELQKAKVSYRHLFVFGHAPLLGSGDNHGPTANAEIFRALLEANGVRFYLNGHNHAYERTYAVRGSNVDPTGTTYITVGSSGAPIDGVNGAWFTAASSEKWTRWGDQEGNTTYLKIHVKGDAVTGQVKSLSEGEAPVDEF